MVLSAPIADSEKPHDTSAQRQERPAAKRQPADSRLARRPSVAPMPAVSQARPSGAAGSLARAAPSRLFVHADSQPEKAADRAAKHVAERLPPDPDDLSRSGSGLRQAPVLPSVADQIQRLGPGQPISAGDRADYDRRFAFDFSRVRVHADAAASDLAALVGARAFTVGSDVVFGRGEHTPHTPRGAELLSHELAHVVQQSRTGMPVLQMARIDDFIKTDPSRVTDAQLDSTDEFKYYMSKNPKPPAKPVVTAEEARLALRLLLRHANENIGATIEPYDLDGFLRTARERMKVASTAEGTVGQQEWVPLSPVDVRGPASSSSDFMKWMLGGGKQPAVPTAKGNCWEMVMFSAFRAGIVSEARMRDIYTKGQAADKALGGLAFPQTIEAELRGGNQEYVFDPKSAGTPRPLRGDIVIFGSAAGHVALATGKLSGGEVEIISHWGPPHHNPKVETTTVEELQRTGARGTIKFWSPSW